MSGTSQDITERTRAEEALRESENQHRTLFETTTQGVMYMDEKGQIVTANPAAERILGLSLDQMQGRTSMDPGRHAIHEDGSDFPGETHPSVVALHTGHEIRNVVMGIFHPPSGNYRWLNVHAVPQFRPGEDRPYQIYTTFDDITAQKHATQERERLLAQIRGQARQMAQVLAAVPEGVLLLDSTGRVLQANPAAERDLADLANVQVGDTLTHLGDRPLADILASPRTRGLWHEVRVDQRTFEVISRPVENGAEPERWVLVVSDVTRERQVRTQLQQQERLVAVGQLAAGIAHDFNNIIGTIILYARLVEQSEALSERNRERLGLVGQQAWHATRLIEQILDFSRRSVLERRPLDLLPLLKEQKKLLERTLPENIRIELSYGQKEYTVNADPTRMQQMLTNLAVNARDAMQRGGTFRIELAREIIQPGDSPLLTPMKPGEWIRLKVSDTGTGIPPEVLPHIFEPFFTTKEPGEGTGLGLAQVHGIVGQHEGHIGIKTRVGEGSTFTIYLPALEVRPARRPSQNIAAAPKGHGQLLLVVEDEPTLRDAMNQVLTLLNYRTLEAKDGQDALELMHEQGDQVALVLSDVVMPVMGGIALFHALREQGWTTPMILLTGHPMDKELDALSELGLTAWMTKPPSLERLATAIDTALGEESGVGA
jgi:two-component system cell cycle sensor histidine kinase/response regulator CckA